MRKKKLTTGERNIRVNEQRFAMTIILCNLLEAENGVSMAIKSATADGPATGATCGTASSRP